MNAVRLLTKLFDIGNPSTVSLALIIMYEPVVTNEHHVDDEVMPQLLPRQHVCQHVWRQRQRDRQNFERLACQACIFLKHLDSVRRL